MYAGPGAEGPEDPIGRLDGFRNQLGAFGRLDVRGRGHDSARVSGLTEALVDQAALNYLNRFDSSVKNLRVVLRRQLKRRLERESQAELSPDDLSQLDDLIVRVLERFQESGLLDDRRLAKNLGDQLRRRGSSARAIRFKLMRKGLSEAHIDEVFQTEASERLTSEVDPELSAAVAYARRRRLGSFRAGEGTREQRQKDLAALARQGFGFRTAELALENPEMD